MFARIDEIYRNVINQLNAVYEMVLNQRDIDHENLINQLKAEHREALNQLDVEIARINAAHRDEIAAKNAEIAAKNAEIAAKNAEIARINAEHEDALNQLNDEIAAKDAIINDISVLATNEDTPKELAIEFIENDPDITTNSTRRRYIRYIRNDDDEIPLYIVRIKRAISIFCDKINNRLNQRANH